MLLELLMFYECSQVMCNLCSFFEGAVVRRGETLLIMDTLASFGVVLVTLSRVQINWTPQYFHDMHAFKLNYCICLRA